MNCLFCKKIIDRHGNGKYCPEKDNIKDYCYTQAKLKRQKQRLIDKISDIAKCERIIGRIEGMLGDKTETVIDVSLFPSEIFLNKNFKKSIINNSEVYKIHLYQFIKVTIDQKEFIKITQVKEENEYRY